MIPIEKIMGRLGNKMWQFAFLYSYARDHGLDFYFQDPHYFKDYKETIRTLYSADIPPMTDYVAIHVRRGDFTDNKFHGDIAKTDYYERAMKYFGNKEEFLVFSDDIQWCKDNLKGNNLLFFESGDEIEDMNAMAACKAHIIANSSFSFWGAWLCPNYPNNEVIAPKDWYADGVIRTVLPEHWIKI